MYSMTTGYLWSKSHLDCALLNSLHFEGRHTPTCTLFYYARMFGVQAARPHGCSAPVQKGTPGVAANLYFREYVPMGIDSL